MKIARIACLGVLLSTTACTELVPGPQVTREPTGLHNIALNDDYAPGAVDLPDIKVPSLSEAENLVRTTKEDASSSKDRLRDPAMRDAALSYGARLALASTSRTINVEVNREAAKLSKAFDFNSLLIKAQGGETVLPPVIAESRDAYEQQDGGNTLRIADTTYQIIQDAHFSPKAPLWYTYLIHSYEPPEKPPEELLPKNERERIQWKRNIREGWEQGQVQAGEIFKTDVRRLDRDFTGMVLYARLLEEGKVTAPIVAETDMGITGTGRNARYHDRLLRITAAPRLNVDHPDEMKAATSSLSPEDASTPPGEDVSQ